MSDTTVTCRPNGTTSIYPLPSESLRHLQDQVGGYVDVIRLGTHLDMWVHDEALVHGDELNIAATKFAHRMGHTSQAIFGTVVITGGADDEGDTVGLTHSHANIITDALCDLTAEAIANTPTVAGR